MKRHPSLAVGNHFVYPGKVHNYQFTMIEIFESHPNKAVQHAINHGLSVVHIHSKDTNELTAFTSYPWNAILVSDGWIKMNEIEKENVIYHEVGHHLFKHSEMKRPSTYEEKIKQEKEAELYAVIHAGKESSLHANTTSLNELIQKRQSERYQKEPHYKTHIDESIQMYKDKIEFVTDLSMENITEKEKNSGVSFVIPSTKVYQLKSDLDIPVTFLGTNEIIVNTDFIQSVKPENRTLYYAYNQAKNLEPQAFETNIKEKQHSKNIEDIVLMTMSKIKKSSQLATNETVLVETARLLKNEHHIDNPKEAILSTLEKAKKTIKEHQSETGIYQKKEFDYIQSYIDTFHKLENKVSNIQSSTIKFQTKEQEVANALLKESENRFPECNKKEHIARVSNSLKTNHQIENPLELLDDTLRRKRAFLKADESLNKIPHKEEIHRTQEYIDTIKSMEIVKKNNFHL